MTLGKHSQYMQNPVGFALQKYMHDLLKEKYDKHQEIMNRLNHYLVTESDVHSFAQMAIDLYESGFMRAVDQHKDQLMKLGLKASIVDASQKKPGNS